MLTIKAFATHDRFANNDKFTTHPFGEASTYTLTYAKDKGIYATESDNVKLYTFNTSQDHEYTKLTPQWSNHVFDVVKFVYNYAIEHAGDKIFADELRRALIAQFGNISQDFRIGAIVDDGNIWMPSWLSWSKIDEPSLIKIWFSDKAFSNQFDEFEIVAVTALPHVDDFFLSRHAIVEKLAEITPDVQTERVELAKNKLPNTRLRTYMFNWVNPLDPEDTIPTQWDNIIYGAAGDNIDSIKDTIRDTILDSSEHSEEEWKKIFPDIFTRTEFTIVPQWDKYAIPEKRIVKGLYTPVGQMSKVYDNYLKDFTKDAHYPKPHVLEYMSSLNFPFKSISLFVTSGNENRKGMFLLNDVFSDLIAVSSLHEDFNRQSKDTREFSEALMNMLIIAEEMDEYTEVPFGFTRVIRHGKVFVVKSIKNVHFLVAAKSNFTVEEPAP